MSDGFEPFTNRLNRDLGLLAGAVVVVVGLAAAGVYSLVDALIHRHRK